MFGLTSSYCEFKYSYIDRTTGKIYDDYFYILDDHVPELKKILAGTCIKPTEKTNCHLRVEYGFDDRQIENIYNALLSRKQSVIQNFDGHNSCALLNFYAVVKTSGAKCSLLEAMEALMKNIMENNIVDDSSDIVLNIDNKKIILNLSDNKISEFKKHFIGAAREINKLDAAIRKVNHFAKFWQLKINVRDDVKQYQKTTPVDYTFLTNDGLAKADRKKANYYEDKPYIELN